MEVKFNRETHTLGTIDALIERHQFNCIQRDKLFNYQISHTHTHTLSISQSLSIYSVNTNAAN